MSPTQVEEVKREKRSSKSKGDEKKPERKPRANSTARKNKATADKPGNGKSSKKSLAERKKNLPKIELAVDPKALKEYHLVAVAYSYVERDWFPTEDAYLAEQEVESRSAEVIVEMEKLGIPAKAYPGDPYLFTNLLVDKPDLVLNLVDTLRGRDSLQTTIPAALELVQVPYTGAGMQGMVIGNDRNLFKQLLFAAGIPTPPFQYIRRKGTKVREDLGLPLIVKLNESGGSVGIDNDAVKESLEDAQEQVNEMLTTYKIPVIIECFVTGPEITVVVFEDSVKKHVFLAKKKFGVKPDGIHEFTSRQSYDDPHAYTYEPVDEELAKKITPLAEKAFTALSFRDYGKFDVRVNEEDGTPYFTDANPNTAFGPDKGLPFTEVLDMYGVSFSEALASLLSKHAKEIRQQ